MTQGELHDILKEKGARLLLDTIPGSCGTVQPVPQPEEEATYASLITRDMERLTGTKKRKTSTTSSGPLILAGFLYPAAGRKAAEDLEEPDPGRRRQPGSTGNGAPGGQPGIPGGLRTGFPGNPGMSAGREKRMPAASFVNGGHVKPGDRLE